MKRRSPVILALSCALALGCTPAAGGGAPTGTGGGTATVKAGNGGGVASPRPGGLASPGAGIIPATATPPPLAPGVGVISNNGSNFVGKVRAPAGIVSNNGGRIISDNGAGFVGKVRRTLLAVDQVPVAGATVRVTDAAGAAVSGPDGKPLEAVTGPDGGFAFPGLKPSQNLLVVADLPAGNGQVQAVALRGQEGAVDLDLVSTLTTAYIHGSWVATQADPNATFARLTPDAERESRLKAEAALGKAGSVELPTFAAADVKLAVEALRKADAAFDAQLEAVRKLLLVAGQEDLGAGRDAKTVFLGYITSVLPLPDGSIAIASHADKRVWRVDPQGRLHVLAGTGRPDRTHASGMRAVDFGLETPYALAFDPAGRLLIAEGARLVRVEADGTVTTATHKQRVRAAAAVVAGPAPDEVLVLDIDGVMLRFAGPALADGPAPLDADGGAATPGVEREKQALGRGPDGTLWVLESAMKEVPSTASDAEPGDMDSVPDLPEIRAYALNPASGQRTPAAALPGTRFGLSPDGTWFCREADGALVAHPPNAPAVRYPAAQLAKLTEDIRANIDEAQEDDGWPFHAQSVVHVGGGRCLIFDSQQVWELTADGGARHLAGMSAYDDRAGGATDVELTDPEGVAIGGDGGIYLIDGGSNRILRLAPDGKTIRDFSGKPHDGGSQTNYDDEGEPLIVFSDTTTPLRFGKGYTASAAEARFAGPNVLRPDGDGLLLLDGESYIRRIGPDGAVTTVYYEEEDVEVLDFLPAAGGGFWMLRTGNEDADEDGLYLVKRGPDGRETIIASRPFAQEGNLALGPGGTVWARLATELGRIDGTAWTKQTTDKRLIAQTGGNGSTGRLAFDAAGRAYFAERKQVLRWAPGGAWEAIAGVGTPLLSGAGTENGLGGPIALTFDRAGDLLIVDEEFEAVKRLTAAELK